MSRRTRTADEVQWKPREQQVVMGTELRRVDGPVKVTGRAKYIHDIRLPGMLWARFVLSPYPRAENVRVDLAPALDVAGVVHARLVERKQDDVRYQGYDSVLAVVAAETPEAAEDGARAVAVQLDELLPPLVTPDQARAADAPELRKGGNVKEEQTRGDEQAALQALDDAGVTIDAVYECAVQHHVCLETHGVVADVRADGATIYHSTQAVSGAPREFAGVLEIPAEDVRVLCEHMGGGFGSKFGAGLEGRQACLLSQELGRPVHLMLTRRDEFLMAGNRNGTRQHLRAGADRDGNLTALLVEAEKYGGMDSGALPTPPYIYRVGTAWSRISAVFTATDPTRAMRAPGHPQASFAMESAVDELAHALGADPLEFRKRNLEHPAYARQLDRCGREIGWADHPHRTAPAGPADWSPEGLATGIGFGVSVWGSGAASYGRCEVRIQSDGSISASTAVQDIGQGVRTLVAAVVAEEFELPIERITVRIGDSALPPGAYSGGSIGTGSTGPPVKHAAYNARLALSERVAPLLECEPEEVAWRGGRAVSRQDPGRSLGWEQACAVLAAEPLVATGEFQEHLHEGGVQGAQAARVRVDTRTGRIRVLDMVCVQNQGIPISRMTLASQIRGGMVQALSYALGEERVFDAELGLMLTADMENYKIAGMAEMPRFTAIIDEGDEREAVMGMAEAAVIPGHGAIANAVFNATGVRLRSMPFTPDRVLAGLAALGPNGTKTGGGR